jgi:hypothetical protein
MNLAAVDKIARAVLYEGYMLYPYRPSSVKNRQRWNFGVICPRSYAEAQAGSEAWSTQTECLVEGSGKTRLEVRVRFLHLAERTVGELQTAIPHWRPDPPPAFQTVARLTVQGRCYQPWQEACEREIVLPATDLESLTCGAVRHAFSFPAASDIEPLSEADGRTVGVLLRQQRGLEGEVEISAQLRSENLLQLKVVLRNTTPWEGAAGCSRDQALNRALVSTHSVLAVEQGKLVSLMAPPDWLRGWAAECQNLGTWPVLVGTEGEDRMMLAAPIILYDYPQIAAESAQDLFDGTEIDEILSLRILTLTEEEKQEMRQSDERARQMLERTEAMPAEQFLKLHGVLRGLRPLPEAE